MDIPELGRRADLEHRYGRANVRCWLETGVLCEIWPGVLISRSRELDRCLRAEAALHYAGADAVLSHRTAAWLQGCSAGDGHTVHVMVPYGCGRRKQAGLALHRGRPADGDVVDVKGLRVQRLEAAVVDVLCTARAGPALAIADQAAALQSVPEFRAEIEARLVEGADRRGTVRAATLLHLVTGLADSPQESQLRLAVVEAGFPLPTAQFPILDLAGALRYVLDMAWPELKIALEYDGFEAHEHRAAADRARDADLERRGWIVIRVTAADLADPRRWIRELSEAFRRRGVHGLDIVVPSRS